ncbi:uncharacterized protein METZ01_LOCUS53470 [marine metagenome]|uniref:DNA mismatch repair proteins mutS family domain-containing protein n=1 Tax=marine metagenome TaxID=408172 RepID=A0A381S9A4_9ZZZZ
MKQYVELKSQYPDTIVLYRMGDFYETFSEDAIVTSRVLGIVLTKRANGKAAEVDLAGFPYHALDNYLPKLVRAGFRVAICEQVEDPKLAKGIVKREVIEVVTPGTLTSDQVLSQKSNQYMASIVFEKDVTGFAIFESSTGEFLVGECKREKLIDYLRKYYPNEVIIGENNIYSSADWYRELRPFVTTIEDWIFSPDVCYRTLLDHFNVSSLKGFGCEDLKVGITAGGGLIYHIHTNLNIKVGHVTNMRPILDEGIMGLDSFTIRNLEVFNSLSTQGTHGTLVDCIDQTETSGGGRLLKKWLHQPLTDINRLNSRLDIVSSFFKQKQLLNNLRDTLGITIDLERVLGKINRGVGTPRDLIGMANTLDHIPDWCKQFQDTNEKPLFELTSKFVDVREVVLRIMDTINEESPAQIKQGNVIKEKVDTELDELRELLFNSKKWISDFQSSESDRLGIPSLKVGFNKVFGYYIEVTRTHLQKVPVSYIRKQTLVNSERYITEELKQYEEKVLTAEERILDIEKRIVQDVLDYIMEHARQIQANAEIINRIDLLSSFAATALSQRYVRPELTDDPILHIVGGRHPVVEMLLSATEKFIPNNLFMDASVNQIHLLTGPNMAGKSTYLRQNGLIVLMAQIGCFIPAKSGTIGIVDRLFTRVGASDNLAGGESTFLVEMNEAANILNNASYRSLILLDEIGRGTATFDGLSIAWAITEYLHQKEDVAARTIFATHYHELTDLEKNLERLKNYHVEVKEHDDRIIFLRTISAGPGDKSYGIHVAKMAGLPGSIISRASEILFHHVKKTNNREGDSLPFGSSNKKSLIQEQEYGIKKALSEMNLDSITPLEALMKLNEIKKEYDL